MMPRMDGYELVSRIKRTETTRHIPVILITAKPELESKLDGLQKGADDYLPKPFGSRELIARIRAVLRRGRMEGPGMQRGAPTKRYQFDRWILETESRELLRDDGVLFRSHGGI